MVILNQNQIEELLNSITCDKNRMEIKDLLYKFQEQSTDGDCGNENSKIELAWKIIDTCLRIGLDITNHILISKLLHPPD